MLDVDYSKYLSLDNGKGVLINKDDVIILKNYGFDYEKYSSLRELIFDVDNYLNDVCDEVDDLEQVLMRISEIDYYVNIKK